MTYQLSLHFWGNQSNEPTKAQFHFVCYLRNMKEEDSVFIEDNDEAPKNDPPK